MVRSLAVANTLANTARFADGAHNMLSSAPVVRVVRGSDETEGCQQEGHGATLRPKRDSRGPRPVGKSVGAADRRVRAASPRR